MEKPPKTLVLISEKLLLDGIVPRDLLEANRFELRSVQHPNEMAILSKVMNPNLLLIDLRDLANLDFELPALLAELRGVVAGKKLQLFPIVGVVSQEEIIDRQTLYEAGINSLLNHPLAVETLQHELQDVLGLSFRRQERKDVNLPVTLRADGKDWAVTGKVINLECLVVEGKDLPPLGMNVFMQSQAPALLEIKLWCFSWRLLKEGGLILRFLDPSHDFMAAIAALPAYAPVAAPTPAPASTYPSPQKIELIKTGEMLPAFAAWLKNTAAAPAEWQALIQNLAAPERQRLLQAFAKKSALAESYFLKILLEAQLQTLRSTTLMEPDKEPLAKIVSAHAELVKRASIDLQKVMIEQMGSGNNAMVTEINALKSDLQKLIVSMQKTVSVKNILSTVAVKANTETAAPRAAPIETKKTVARRPAKKKWLSEEWAERLQTAFTRLGIVALVFGTIYLSYFQWTAPQRSLSTLDQDDVQSLSKHFTLIKQFEGKGQKNLTILLNPSWDQLSKEDRDQELKVLTEKFKLLEIHYAELVHPKGSREATYANGHFRSSGVSKSANKNQ